nr:RNA methyltransferase [Phytoactinopolyspora alkaliphila]
MFLAEGAQAVREAVRSGADRVVEILVTPGAQDRHPDIVTEAAQVGIDVRVAGDAALASLSETVTPQGLVAICRSIVRTLDDVLPADDAPATSYVLPAGDPPSPDGPSDSPAPGPPSLVAVLVDARDPGNAGTVIRCADAAGADAVLFSHGSVDPESGKAVRASAGSLFHIPVVSGAPAHVIVQRLRQSGLTVLAADGSGDLDLDEAEAEGILSRPTAWLFGNEAWGLPDEVRAVADHVVRVPIYGQAESLNLATAAAVCLYASARVLRTSP